MLKLGRFKDETPAFSAPQGQDCPPGCAADGSRNRPAGGLVACSGAAPVAAAPVCPAQTPPQSADSAGIIAAAQSFIQSLPAEQQTAASYPFADPRRSNWSNLPSGLVDFEHNGIRVGDMDASQRAALCEFLAAALSQDGYDTVIGIVGADSIVRQADLLNRLLSGVMGWSEDNYWLAFFGTPEASRPWGWQFGGHHLGVNVTVADGRSYLSPTFIGIEPATYQGSDGQVVVLAAEAAAGLDLMRALDGSTRQAATIGDRPEETLTGAGKDGVIPALEGSNAGDWTAAQQQLLLDAIARWVELLPAASAQARLAEIEADLAETYFAWHGAIDGSEAIYYRIQGPRLIIEYSTQGALGAEGGHYHSVYRDPTNDYGQKL